MALAHEKALLEPLSDAELKELVRLIGKLQTQINKLWTTTELDE
jgi:hypothetical protein